MAEGTTNSLPGCSPGEDDVGVVERLSTEKSKNPQRQDVEEEAQPSCKKQRVDCLHDISAEEKDLKTKDSGVAVLGPKTFVSSVDMFHYFYGLLHFWPVNLNINKYEYLVLMDLLKKGHSESERKIGVGIKGFQVRNHPEWKSRCFFLVRDDNTLDDFSFRKCVDHILPLPENLKVRPEANKFLSKGKGGGGRGYGRGGKGRK